MRLGAERIVALTVAAGAVSVFALTWTFPPTPPALVQGMSPAAYPRLICAVIVLLAALLLLDPPPEGEAQPPLGGVFWWTIVCCIAYALAIYAVGMVGAGLLFLIVAARLWGERRWPVLLAVSAGTMASVWLVFVRGFGIVLPLGLLGD